MFGPFLDLAANQEQKQDSKDGVHAHEADQGEEHVAGGDIRRKSRGGAHDAVDQPGLAAEFGGHPARGGGDIGKGQLSMSSHSSLRES